MISRDRRSSIGTPAMSRTIPIHAHASRGDSLGGSGTGTARFRQDASGVRVCFECPPDSALDGDVLRVGPLWGGGP